MVVNYYYFCKILCLYNHHCDTQYYKKHEYGLMVWLNCLVFVVETVLVSVVSTFLKSVKV